MLKNRDFFKKSAATPILSGSFKKSLMPPFVSFDFRGVIHQYNKLITDFFRVANPGAKQL